MVSAILKVTCKDRKGILASVTSFISQNNGNIISLDEFADNETKLFFMRLEWDLEGFRIEKENLKHEIEKLAEKTGFKDNFELFYSDKKLKMAIMVSKYDHCLYDLLLRQKSGELKCDIPVIISNHEDLRNVAEFFNVPFEVIPINKDNKREAEQKQDDVLKKYHADFVVMARYMQVLSDDLIRKWNNKIINIHHSSLPAFEGAKPYHQAYARGVKIIGATAHFANSDLDKGPIIIQGVAPISHEDSVDNMITKGRDTERKVLADAVKLYISHRIFINDNRTIIL